MLVSVSLNQSNKFSKLASWNLPTFVEFKNPKLFVTHCVILYFKVSMLPDQKHLKKVSTKTQVPTTYFLARRVFCCCTCTANFHSRSILKLDKKPRKVHFSLAAMAAQRPYLFSIHPWRLLGPRDPRLKVSTEATFFSPPSIGSSWKVFKVSTREWLHCFLR